MMTIPRVLAATAATPLLLGAALIATARVQGGHPPTPWPQLAAFTPLAFVFAVAGLALAAAVGARWLMLPASTLTLGLALVPLPSTSAALAPLAGPAASAHARTSAGGGHGDPLTVMTVNALLGRVDCGDVVAAVRDHHVDILAVEELTEPSVHCLDARGLARELPHRSVLPAPEATGTGLWSRFPLTALPPVPRTTFAMPRAAISLPSGALVTATAAHPTAPRPSSTGAWVEDLDRLLDTAVATAGPQIVLGDFNASSDHAPFRAFARHGFVDTADHGRTDGPGWTWPEGTGLFPLVRLDHVLVSSAHLVPLETRTLRLRGTDHRAVVATVRLRAPVATVTGRLSAAPAPGAAPTSWSPAGR